MNIFILCSNRGRLSIFLLVIVNIYGNLVRNIVLDMLETEIGTGVSAVRPAWAV